MDLLHDVHGQHRPPGADAGGGRGEHADRQRGRADLVAYELSENGVENLWEQPVAGGPARKLTKFTTGLIFHFAYNPGRTRLFISRGTRTGDMVLIRDFQ